MCGWGEEEAACGMLEEVRITGLGVINDALLELSPGFTALTGETGAGKTMVVTGLGLLFGGRAGPARRRTAARTSPQSGGPRSAPPSRGGCAPTPAGRSPSRSRRRAATSTTTAPWS